MVRAEAVAVREWEAIIRPVVSEKKSVSFFRVIRSSVALYPLYFADYWIACNVVQHFSSHAHRKDDES